jgi:PAS domain S-box-containing protein
LVPETPGHGPEQADPFAADGQLDAFRTGYARRVAAIDGLAALAARLLGASGGEVLLIDDRHTGSGGARPRLAPTATTTAEALSALVAGTGEPVRVDDGAADPRVQELGLVDGRAVGAYLGVPLISGGAVLGALCVFGPQPRTWTEDDVSSLTSLAQSVTVELELAALEADYEGERVIWRLAMDAGGVGAFDWDLVTGELRWDERLLELFGLDRDSFGGTIDAFNAAVHPEDRDRVTEALRATIDSCGTFAAEYRVILPDGDVRWISSRGRALAGPGSSAARVLGTASDTTAVQEEEARVARVLESMPTAFFSLDRSWRFTYANGEAKRLLGAIGAEIVGGVIWERFPAAVGSEFEEQYRHAMETGEPVVFEAYYPPPLHAWYEVRAWPTPDGLSVYFIDISTRRRAEETLALASRRSALLADVAAELADTWDADEAVARLAQLIVPELGEWCVITLTDGGELAAADWRRGLRDVGWWHADPAARPLVERYCRTRLEALTDNAFLARALARSSPIVVDDDAARMIASVLTEGEARDLCLRLDPRFAVVVPMRARGRILGALTMFRGQTDPAFTAEDIAILEQVASRAGLALDNARLYAEQRDLAEQLQRSMMTAPPQPDHVQVAVRYVPAAEVAQVGGDWYDAFLQPDGATMVVIGDVIGHDTAAAAAMGQIRNILRGVAVATRSSPAQLLSQVDAVMSELLIEITATAVVARLEQTPQERRQGLTRLRWSNAGHPPPVVVGDPRDSHEPPRTEVLWGREPNLLLGLEPGAPRDETVVTLQSGSTLLLYTDGLVERRGELIDTGIERLTDVLAELVVGGLALEELCDELLRRMLSAKPDDDVAIVAVRLYREHRPRPAEAGPPRVPDEVPPPPDVGPAPPGPS